LQYRSQHPSSSGRQWGSGGGGGTFYNPENFEAIDPGEAEIEKDKIRAGILYRIRVCPPAKETIKSLLPISHVVDRVCHLLVTHAADNKLGVGFVIFHEEDMQWLAGKFNHKNHTIICRVLSFWVCESPSYWQREPEGAASSLAKRQRTGSNPSHQ
jgi:hypothetical protein